MQPGCGAGGEKRSSVQVVNAPQGNCLKIVRLPDWLKIVRSTSWLKIVLFNRSAENDWFNTFNENGSFNGSYIYSAAAVSEFPSWKLSTKPTEDSLRHKGGTHLEGRDTLRREGHTWKGGTHLEGKDTLGSNLKKHLKKETNAERTFICCYISHQKTGSSQLPFTKILNLEQMWKEGKVILSKWWLLSSASACGSPSPGDLGMVGASRSLFWDLPHKRWVTLPLMKLFM